MCVHMLENSQRSTELCHVLGTGPRTEACLSLGFADFEHEVHSHQVLVPCILSLAGEMLQFHVVRTPPGRGNVTVNWKVIGQNLEVNFANSTGQLFFSEVAP